MLLLTIVILLSGCTSEEQNTKATQNKVMLLKVDFTTNIFEGGKELAFGETTNFTISPIYQSPGDLGNITLKYQELDEKIFDGTIIWMGTGKRNYPENINSPESFIINPTPLQIPNLDFFQTVNYSEFPHYPETINYAGIWNAIDNLEVVAQYRNSNPNSQINLFLYTPSVGGGDPEEWDWYVILKN